MSVVEWSEVCTKPHRDVVATCLQLGLVFDQLSVSRAQTTNRPLKPNSITLAGSEPAPNPI